MLLVTVFNAVVGDYLVVAMVAGMSILVVIAVSGLLVTILVVTMITAAVGDHFDSHRGHCGGW